MDDTRDRLDVYAAADPFDGDCGKTFKREEAAPEAFAALRAVLDQHPLVHDEVDRCRGCWNAVHDNYERWPCATIRAITTALEAS